MEIGKVEKYILEKIKKEGAILSVIIDPCDYPSPERAIETGTLSYSAGADIIAVGGSTGAQGPLLDGVVKGIKENVKVPVVLFPGNIATFSAYADAVYFMSLLNSRNTYWVSSVQTLGAPLLFEMKMEPLPIGYILVEPGGTAGWVGEANLVPRNKPKIAAALALAGQYSGKRIIFTDAGSDAFAPIPSKMAFAVAKVIDVPYLVAGGIKTPEQAEEIIKAGADWVQIGTVAERTKDVKETISKFVKKIKKAGKEK